MDATTPQRTRRMGKAQVRDSASHGEVERRAHERRDVELALRHDATAFRSIVERHHRGMYAFAVRLLGDRAEADDVVQDAFARAFCRLGQYDPSYQLSTWLYRIVLNLCRDRLKSPRRREIRGSFDSHADHASPGPEAELVAARRAERVRYALSKLRPTYREVLVLKDLQELSYEEVRAITGTPVTALKIRAIRARKTLRALLEEDPT